MKLLNNILRHLPIVIFSYWCLSLLFVYTDFWSENYYLINAIDTFLVGLSFAHFGLNYKIYNKTSKIFLSTFVVEIFLIKVDSDFSLKDELFYFLYTIILAIALIYAIKINLNK